MSAYASSSRSDRRSPSDMRPLSAEFGQLDRADGSGRFGFGPSAALASMTGPIEVRLKEELPDKATLEITHRPLEGISATPSRALINTLHAVLPPLLVLGQHPRALIQLVVQSLSPAPATVDSSSSVTFSSSASQQTTWPPAPVDDEDDYVPDDKRNISPMSGSFFAARAAAINASALAILDAGSVALRAIPIAVSLAFTQDRSGTKSLILDPSSQEENTASSRHVFAWAFGQGISSEGRDGNMEVDHEEEAELVYTENEGEFSQEELERAMGEGRAAAKQVLAFVRGQIGPYLDKRVG